MHSRQYTSARLPTAAMVRTGYAPVAAELPVGPLEGHSGATLTLMQQDGALLVRKTAGTPTQGDRLQRQSEKQRHLTVFGLPLPRVLAEGWNDEKRFFFDMEYVPGQTAAALLRDDKPFDPAPFLDALQRLLTLFRLSVGAPIEPAVFHDKIAQIVARSRVHSPCAAHVEAIARIGANLDALSWEGIPASLDHGDLTLENILICPDRGPVFIDCDAGWVSSYWLDIAKLHQDVLGHWFLRDLYLTGKGGLENVLPRLDQLELALRNMAGALAPSLVRYMPQLAALHLFRTLPYIRDERVTAFVLQRMDCVLVTTKE